MAVVYRAVLPGPHGFERPVALKCVKPEMSKDERFAARFVREARLSALLHHRGVVQIHELGEADGECFLAMELIEGHSLGTLIDRSRRARTPLPLGLAVYLASEVAAALDYVHALADEEGRPYQIVHRDISPSNIMLSKQGAIKLLDFGIAKAVLSLDETRTRSGLLEGKFRYFSPEQARGERLDGRSDLFALGCVLYECLAPRPTFIEIEELALLEEVKKGEYMKLSQIRAELPPGLEAIVDRLLAPDREQRFQRGSEVVEALQPLRQALGFGPHELEQWLAAQRDLSSGKQADSGLGRAATREPTESSGPSPTDGAQPRRRVVAVAVAAFALAAAATVGLRVRAARTPLPEAVVPASALPPPGPAASPAPSAPPTSKPDPAPVDTRPAVEPRPAPAARKRKEEGKRAGAAAHPLRSPDIHDPFKPDPRAAPPRR